MDLGETMVIAHAAVAAETGEDVTILIDDGEGCRVASAEARRLQRMLQAGKAVGSISLIHTVTVLERAAGGEHIPNKNAMRSRYGRLKELDDGLPPLEATTLLSDSYWRWRTWSAMGHFYGASFSSISTKLHSWSVLFTTL